MKPQLDFKDDILVGSNVNIAAWSVLEVSFVIRAVGNGQTNDNYMMFCFTKIKSTVCYIGFWGGFRRINMIFRHSQQHSVSNFVHFLIQWLYWSKRQYAINTWRCVIPAFQTYSWRKKEHENKLLIIYFARDVEVRRFCSLSSRHPQEGLSMILSSQGVRIIEIFLPVFLKYW